MAVDWRAQIRSNQNRTYCIIASFLVLYGLLGALVALFMNPSVSVHRWGDVLAQRRSLEIILIFTVVGIIITIVSVFFGGRLSLSGSSSQQVSSNDSEPKLKQLYNIVEEMKIASGLNYMPKIYVLDVGYLNAFASGYSEKNALVAITKPLLNVLTRDELQAVMAHELSHIRNQDTRVLTLVSVMAGLIVMVVDTLFRGVLYGGNSRSNKSKGGANALILVVVLLRIILPILTAFMVMYVSRRREFLADAGCVSLTRDNESLANALIKIHQYHVTNKEEVAASYKDTPHEGLRSLSYIYSPLAGKIKNRLNINDWFATHPSLEQRLEALGVAYKEKPDHK